MLKAYINYLPDELIDEKKAAIPNRKELSYGLQRILIYEDFNFDGIKDFAILNGNNSCYSGPSFDIYITGKNDQVVYNDEFSALSNDYCGMFEVDVKAKRLYT